MPTAQARMTRARGPHATRSRRWSVNGTSSLPEQKNRVQILLVPMALCAHVPRPKCQDNDLHRPMAWFPGAYVLRALSWAHVRVWGAAGRGCHTPASPGSAHFVCFPYVNRALFGISTSAHRLPPCWHCMSCAPYAEQLGTSWRPPTAAVTRPDDWGVLVLHVQNAKLHFMLPMHASGGTWSRDAWFPHGNECPR